MRTRKILADNLRALMAREGSTLTTLPDITKASRGVLSNGKLDRIRRASNATDVDSLELLAQVFKCESWQLLVPNLKPEAMPVLFGPEHIAQIRALVVAPVTADLQEIQPEGVRNSAVAGTKERLGRQPGELLHAVQGQGKSGEVSQPAAVPPKRSSRGSKKPASRR